jgi:hypothetical protein
MLLGEVLVAAARTQAEASRLADRAAELGQSLTGGATGGEGGDERDRAVDRLLEIAAALDDQLAQLGRAPERR